MVLDFFYLYYLKIFRGRVPWLKRNANKITTGNAFDCNYFGKKSISWQMKAKIPSSNCF